METMKLSNKEGEKIMPTLKIILEAGKFVGTEGASVQVFEPTYVAGNGWEAMIKQNGSIECYAIAKYKDGEHSLRYLIDRKGMAKLTLKKPGKKKPKILRKNFVLPKGVPLEYGVLGLSGGYIDRRYAFFREPSFQAFLNEKGIDSVHYKDPNKKQFVLLNDDNAKIITDGRQKVVLTTPEGNEVINLEEATWAMFVKEEEGNSCRILYTLENDLEKLEIPS